MFQQFLVSEPCTARRYDTLCYQLCLARDFETGHAASGPLCKWAIHGVGGVIESKE